MIQATSYTKLVASKQAQFAKILKYINLKN